MPALLSLRRLSYAVAQIPQNLAAPALDRVREKRGIYGIDGDAGMAVHILDAVFRPVPGGASVIRDARCLELGPGRTPNVAIALALLGARDVSSIDVRSPPELTPAAVDDTLAALRAGGSAARLREGASLTADDLTSRAERVRSGELPVTFGQYDGARLAAPEGRYDLAISKSVLEHVAADSVAPLLADLFRVSAPGALMSHWIDFRDHMRIVSDSETKGDWLDALAYPEWLYRLMYSKRIVAVNRLRHREWRSAFAAAGFESVADDVMEADLPAGFTPERLDARWRAMPRDEFRRSQAIMVLRRAAPAG